MLLFEWNALRVGDRVLVHDDSTLGLDLREATVRLVQTHAGAASDVGIRLDDGEMRYPRRNAVHMQPLDRRFSCWRCDAISGGTAGASRRLDAA